MEHKTTGAELPDFAEGINLHGERLRLEAFYAEQKRIRKQKFRSGLVTALNMALIILIITLSVAIWIMIYQMLY
jgi:hypothetical protein|nr:MAG TPA: protein of unknown function (DUF5345) [Caudoviricetes sp.]